MGVRAIVFVVVVAGACGQAAPAEPVAVVAPARAPIVRVIPTLPVAAPADEVAVNDGDEPNDEETADDAEADTDVDDVPDVDDRCPDVPESIDGIDDPDGCPESVPLSAPSS
jgi:hypothetical protein